MLVNGPKPIDGKITRARRVGQNITERRDRREGPREQSDGFKLSCSMKSLSPLANLDEPFFYLASRVIRFFHHRAKRDAKHIPSLLVFH